MAFTSASKLIIFWLLQVARPEGTFDLPSEQAGRQSGTREPTRCEDEYIASDASKVVVDEVAGMVHGLSLAVNHCETTQSCSEGCCDGQNRLVDIRRDNSNGDGSAHSDPDNDHDGVRKLALFARETCPNCGTKQQLYVLEVHNVLKTC